MRIRIYRTERMNNRKKAVVSGTPGEWAVYGIIKWVFKVLLFCGFFWIIIPIKLFKRK